MTQLRPERVALVAPGGAVSIIDMPAGAPDELRIAGERYAKAVFQPEAGVPGRWIFSAVWPLEQHLVEKVRWAFIEDDRKQRAALRVTDTIRALTFTLLLLAAFATPAAQAHAQGAFGRPSASDTAAADGTPESSSTTTRTSGKHVTVVYDRIADTTTITGQGILSLGKSHLFGPDKPGVFIQPTVRFSGHSRVATSSSDVLLLIKVTRVGEQAERAYVHGPSTAELKVLIDSTRETFTASQVDAHIGFIGDVGIGQQFYAAFVPVSLLERWVHATVVEGRIADADFLFKPSERARWTEFLEFVR